MKIAFAMTGASGSPYALRLLQYLSRMPHEVHLTISPCAATVLRVEEGLSVDLADFRLEDLLGVGAENIRYFRYDDFMAPMASGSAKMEAMVICPCSCGALARIAHGIADDLITRAADVFLKERRKLILVTRETPLNLIHLHNMVTVTEAGAIVLPACPNFYQHPQTKEELLDTVVSRILDHLGIEWEGKGRWGGFMVNG